MAKGDYREVSIVSLQPLYISLAVPFAAFGDGATGERVAPFSTVMAAEVQFPDHVWLFKGEDVYRYDVRSGTFAADPQPMRDVFGTQWPMSFASGIDAATWAGPAHPDLHYAFSGSQFIRWQASTGKVDGPLEIATSGWWSAQDGFFAQGCDAVLHDVRPQQHGVLHIFRGDQYLRHDLQRASNVAGPGPISQFWKLPKPFCDRIDLAFYGAGGENATKVCFICGDQSVRYDLATDTCDEPQPVDRRLPAFAPHLPAPQLFLREHFDLNTYVTDPTDGRLLGTVNTAPLAKEIVRVVTEVVETTNSKSTDTVLASTDQATVRNLQDEIRSHDESSGATDSHRYSFDASFHGEVEAKGVWGGEASANAHAQGGSDNVHEAFGQAVDTSIAKQVTNSARNLRQSVTTTELSAERKTRVLREEVKEIDNSGNDQVVSTAFYQLMDRYLTLLVLRNVDLVFADGVGPQQVANVADLDDLLAAHLPDEDARQKVRSLLVENVTTVRDASGAERSMLQPGTGSGPLQVDTAIRSTHEVVRPDGTNQAVTVPGIIIHAKEQLAPSTAIIARRI